MLIRKLLLFIAFSTLVFLFSGCEEKETFDDMFVNALREMIIEDPKHPEESKQIARQAIKTWENDKYDAAPILVEAAVSSASRAKNILFGVYCYDESKDILGIIVEEHFREDGSDKILVEKYPVFEYYTFSEVVSVVSVVPCDVKSRNQGELKDEKLWEKFVSKLPDPYEVPPVIISLENEEVDVYITLYDRQGNKSNKVKLIEVGKLE